jgi:hypothetical protein
VAACPGPNPPALRADLAAAQCRACAGRNYLRDRRLSITNMAGGAVAMSGLQLEGAWTQRALTLIQNLYAEFMPVAPCQYAFCLTGSGARKEACPFSDVDCFIVVDPLAGAGHINTLATASRSVRERLVDMNWRGAGPDQDKGFVFCIGGLNPEGWNSVGTPPQRLIDTPHALAGILEANVSTGNPAMQHVVSGLQEADFGFGHRPLFVDFQREVNLIMGKTCWKLASRPVLSYKKRQGLDAIRDAVNNPDFQIPAAGNTRFQIKKEFYRLPQFLAKGLAWYYAVEAVRTLDQIAGLQADHRMSDTNARHFINAINKAARVRVLSHLHAGSESDHVRTAAHPPPNPNNEYVLTGAELADLQDVIRSLTRLRNLAIEFVRQKDKFSGKRKNPFA